MSRAVSEKDLEIILALNDTPFNRAMERARSELRRTISEMERDTQLAVGQIRNRTMREMGLDPWAERAISARHEMELYQRQRWGVGVGGMGQDLVAPGRMSRNEMIVATAGAGAALTSLRAAATRVAIPILAIKTTADTVHAAFHAWRGEVQKTEEALSRLPIGIRHIQQAGAEMLKPIAEGLFAFLYSPGVRGVGPRARALGAEAAEMDRQIAAGMATKQFEAMAKEFGRAGWLAGASPEQREAFAIRERLQANLQRIAAGPEGATPESRQRARAAAFRAAEDEMWALERQRTDRIHQEANRREEIRQRERKQEEDEQRRKLDEQRHWATEYEAVSSEILQRRLDRLGFGLEAERERIRQSYRSRIRDAREAGQEQLAARLEQLRDAEIYGARAPGMGVPFQVINTRYVDPGGLALGGQRERTLQDIKNLNEGQLNELKRLVSLMTEGN